MAATAGRSGGRAQPGGDGKVFVVVDAHDRDCPCDADGYGLDARRVRRRLTCDRRPNTLLTSQSFSALQTSHRKDPHEAANRPRARQPGCAGSLLQAGASARPHARRAHHDRRAADGRWHARIRGRGARTNRIAAGLSRRRQDRSPRSGPGRHGEGRPGAGAARPAGPAAWGRTSARAALSAAQVNLDQAAADFKRFKDLRDQGFISSAELERRETTLKAAQAQLDAGPRAEQRAGQPGGLRLAGCGCEAA